MSQFTFSYANPVVVVEPLPQLLAAFSPKTKLRMHHAISNMPPAHLARPIKGETYLTRDEAYERCQNFAFRPIILS